MDPFETCPREGGTPQAGRRERSRLLHQGGHIIKTNPITVAFENQRG